MMALTQAERDAHWDEFISALEPYLRASPLQQTRIRVQGYLEEDQVRRRAGRPATLDERWGATLRKAEQRILSDRWLEDADKVELIGRLLETEHQVIIRHIGQRTMHTEYELIDLRERVKWLLRKTLGGH
jgi:hypothetical protein